MDEILDLVRRALPIHESCILAGKGRDTDTMHRKWRDF
jgi:hypothetical protein